MRLDVTFHGLLIKLCSTNSITLEFDSKITRDIFLDELEKQYPQFEKYRKYVLCAVNDEFIDDTYQFKDNDRVDILPPASGG